MTLSWHASPEESAREFIAADIERGFTFVQEATADNAQRQPAWRSHLLRNAAHAYAEAEWRIAEADGRWWDMGALRAQLRRLQEALRGLEPVQRKAA